jgi:hypothetical protein
MSYSTSIFRRTSTKPASLLIHPVQRPSQPLSVSTQKRSHSSHSSEETQLEHKSKRITTSASKSSPTSSQSTSSNPSTNQGPANSLEALFNKVHRSHSNEPSNPF